MAFPESLVPILVEPFARAAAWAAGLFTNQGRARSNAANWLETAERVWHYRRDRLTAAEAEELNRRRDELARSLRERADPGKLKLGIEALEGILRRTGGALYPRTALAENVEFFLVAALVILGVRTYFVQPFEIPTNSMWPTYYGMTAENFPPGAPAPGPFVRAVRFVTLLAWRHEVDAPAGGAVSTLFYQDQSGDAHLFYQAKPGRTWGVFPADFHVYSFFVGDREVDLSLPADFDGADQLVTDTFFGGDNAKLQANFNRQVLAGAAERIALTGGEAYRVPLDREARPGEPLLRFDILTGDKLFVDRFSYHFVRPHAGSGMVFRTGDNPAIAYSAGVPPPLDEYYIKRLVGVPGDTIEIRQPVLYRNGAPATGSEAFRLNNGRVPPYRGYFNMNGSASWGPLYLHPGEKLVVPPHSFFGLGDNSRNSADGRYWGFVPERDLVGRPLFIYYPFTRRWGPAK